MVNNAKIQSRISIFCFFFSIATNLYSRYCFVIKDENTDENGERSQTLWWEKSRGATDSNMKL